MEVVKNLNVERYMGRWYEIASFPSRFQPKDGVDTRATYSLNPDGTIHVLNETWSGGKRGYIEGTAYKADPNSDEAKLKVKFYVPPFLPIIPVTGDYWVLHIDPDYQYALIGQPSRNYLWVILRRVNSILRYLHSSLILCTTIWGLGTVLCHRASFLACHMWYTNAAITAQILCRQPRLDDDTYNQLVEKAKEVGYDVSKLHKTPHSESPPEGDNAPTDSKGVWWLKSIFGR